MTEQHHDQEHEHVPEPSGSLCIHPAHGPGHARELAWRALVASERQRRHREYLDPIEAQLPPPGADPGHRLHHNHDANGEQA